ncbi:membrane protein [Brevundimonas phage vB_BsubS-Delta]|nr:membrane protein [Brevundimonas phage vB_BsubS-Delta]
MSAPVAETQHSKPPRKPWIKLPVDLKRVGEWISMLRDLAALLFIPFLCFYGAIMVYVLIRFFGTPERPESVVLAVVNYLGAALVGLCVLIGLGVLWLQRRNIPTLSVTTPMGTVNIGSGDAAQAGLAGAVIDAITPADAPSVAAAAAGGAPPPSKETATAAADAEFEPEPAAGGKS